MLEIIAQQCASGGLICVGNLLGSCGLRGTFFQRQFGDERLDSRRKCFTSLCRGI